MGAPRASSLCGCGEEGGAWAGVGGEGRGRTQGAEQGAGPEKALPAGRASFSGSDRPAKFARRYGLPRVHPVVESCPGPPGRPHCLLSVVSRPTCLIIFPGLWRPTHTLAAPVGSTTPGRSMGPSPQVIHSVFAECLPCAPSSSLQSTIPCPHGVCNLGETQK